MKIKILLVGVLLGVGMYQHGAEICLAYSDNRAQVISNVLPAFDKQLVTLAQEIEKGPVKDECRADYLNQKANRLQSIAKDMKPGIIADMARWYYALYQLGEKLYAQYEYFIQQDDQLDAKGLDRCHFKTVDDLYSTSEHLEKNSNVITEQLKRNYYGLATDEKIKFLDALAQKSSIMDDPLYLQECQNLEARQKRERQQRIQVLVEEAGAVPKIKKILQR